MKKTILGRTLLAFGLILIALFFWIGMKSGIRNQYFVQLSETDVLYFYQEMNMALSLIIAFVFATISFLLEKNYKFTRWFLFVVLLLIIGASSFVIMETANSSDALIFALIFGFIITISVGLIILSFVIKNKAWTKWVMMSGSALLFVAALFITIIATSRSYNKDWGRTITILESNEGNKVVVQLRKKDEEDKRFLLTEPKYLILDLLENRSK